MDIYEVSGISKQSHWQYMQRRKLDSEKEFMAINSILDVRSMHPSMGLKKIYYLLVPDWIGRDRFIDFGVSNGLEVKQVKNYARTTFSNKSACFINLLAGLVIKDINIVWVSDITYFKIGQDFFYITFIEDIYSRRILGYHAGSDLRAENNCKALEMALKNRNGMDLSSLIHHSDKGTQYTSDKYLRMLLDRNIKVSMCGNVFENSHMERTNGIIKNEYLIHYKINSLKNLRYYLQKAVNLYNDERPHWNLFRKPPLKYEQDLQSISYKEREEMKIYTTDTTIQLQESMFV